MVTDAEHQLADDTMLRDAVLRRNDEDHEDVDSVLHRFGILIDRTSSPFRCVSS